MMCMMIERSSNSCCPRRTVESEESATSSLKEERCMHGKAGRVVVPGQSAELVLPRRIRRQKVGRCGSSDHKHGASGDRVFIHRTRIATDDDDDDGDTLRVSTR